MSSFKISDKPEATAADPADVRLLGLDTGDATEAETGSLKQYAPGLLHRSLVPSATALSSGDAVNDYIDARIAEEPLSGPTLLPRGDIQQDNPLTVEQRLGVTVAGAGPNYNSTVTDSNNSWDSPAVNRSTRFEFDGSSSSPAAQLLGCTTCCLRDLAIEHLNNGECLRVGRSGTFYGSFNRCERVWFHQGSIGCRFTADGSGILNSDHCFDNCVFADCGTGVQTDGLQQVAYSFNGMSYWLRCDVAIECVGGGCTYTHGCSCNGVGVFLRATAGGSDTGPHVISGLRLDRTGEAPLPVVVDFSPANSGGARRASVDGVQVTSGGTLGDHFFFKLNESYAAEGSEIQIGLTNLRKFGPVERVHAIGVYNDSGTRVGHVYDGVYTALADENF